MILLIDNYDSFTFNLAQAIGTLGEEVVVHRNDTLDAATIRAMRPDGIVLSPGPGRPETAGCCEQVVRELRAEIPILGVCLGHQAIATALGGRVVAAPEVVHGKLAEVDHDGTGLYAGLPSPMTVSRYHSLVVEAESLPAELVVDARAGRIVMGMHHRDGLLYGVQFHPESIATPDGVALLRNFLRMVSGDLVGPRREEA